VVQDPEAVTGSLVTSEKTDMTTLTPARKARNEARTGGGLACGGPTGRNEERSAGALGINAKLSANRMDTRVARFSLQSVARSILPKSRTAKCLRIRAYNSEIQVWKHHEHNTAAYAGLQTCGSVWSCPICAAKVAERRRAELQAAMAVHRAGAGAVTLLTLTTPHQKTDKLSELLENQSKALHRFWRDRTVKEVFKDMGTIGHVRALEVTHGRKSPSNNGWHPHYHCLMFCGSGVDLGRFDGPQMKDWQVRLYLRWAACCVKSGLGEPSYAHGLKLDDGTKAGNYAAKWGLEDEMTKGHTKKSLHGETPFDFLRAYLADGSDRQAAALFSEFSETFKGKRQLSWSKGLKALFAIEETSDEELSTRVEESAILLGLLTVDQWRDVLKVDGRATVLEIAARAGWPEVQRYLWFIEGACKGVHFDREMLAEARTLLLG
jgi:Replication protein